MSSLKNIAKEGWHPKSRDGGKESWRGDFKGINQVAGWMGKGQDSSSTSDRAEHASQPLSSLKDPASFGPPPKHSGFYGAAANGTTSNRSNLGAPQQPGDTRQQQQQQQQQRQAEIEEEEEEQERQPPPVPYRVNTTGLATDHLPPPPRRVDSTSPGSTNARPKPSLPPRLPPRTNSAAPPPAYSAVPESGTASDGYINQGATSRLANAGVSVPALGIRDNGSQDRINSTSNTPASPSTGHGSINALQNRFSQMRTNSSARDEAGSGSSSGGVRSTVSDFRERHSDKIDAGKQKMTGLNEKYGPSQRSTPAGDAGNEPASASGSGGIRSTMSDFRERHSDKIDAGKQKMSGLNEKYGPSHARDEPSPASASGGGTRSTVGDLRERHGDKIDAGKQKIGGINEKYGISQRARTFVDNQKSSASGGSQRPAAPAPPPPRPQPTSSSSASSTVDTGIANKKKPPPPPPKRAAMRAPAVNESAVNEPSPGPPPLPLATKPR